MDYNQIMRALKAGDIAPLYLLHGEETYYIDQVADYLENHVLSEAEKGFNFTVRHGRDTIKRTGTQGGVTNEPIDFQVLYNDLSRLPMMAARQLVILKEAQAFKDLNKLERYVSKPVPTTIFVLCHPGKKLSKATKLGKAFSEQEKAGKAVILEVKKLYDNQVPQWIDGYLRDKQLKIRPDAAQLLAENVGTDLAKLTNELDKLALNVPKGKEITAKLVERFVGISREYNIFELQRAIGERDLAKAQRILDYFKANPKKGPLVVVVATLYNFFSKLYMYHAVSRQSEKDILKALGLRSGWFLKEYRAAAKYYTARRTEAVLGILREYDLKGKGVDYNLTGTGDNELLKEMVVRIVRVMSAE